MPETSKAEDSWRTLGRMPVAPSKAPARPQNHGVCNIDIEPRGRYRSQQMERLYREIGRLLRERREKAELSQSAVAGRVGLSRTSITNIENGRQHVTLHVLYALADAVGTTPGALLPDPSALVGERDTGLDKTLKKLPVKLDQESKDWIQRLVTNSKTRRREPQ